jgi:hypothetical protein
VCKLLAFGGCVGLDPKRVNVRREQPIQRIINHSVPLNPALTLECVGYNGYVEMASAILGAFVPRM